MPGTTHVKKSVHTGIIWSDSETWTRVLGSWNNDAGFLTHLSANLGVSHMTMVRDASITESTGEVS